jgi:hypothetical protein
MTLPNFLIIGVAKSATTALWFYLKQHPEIFMSFPKEPRFFAYMGQNIDFKGPGDKLYKKAIVRNLDDYKNLFKDVNSEKAIGEASVAYFSEKHSADRIKSYIPDVKLILSLRNPVDRAFSHYLNKRRNGHECIKDFEEALKEENNRIQKNYSHTWRYIGRGFYYENIKYYLDKFGSEQMKIYIYDDFKKHTLLILKDIFKFIEVDDSFVPDLNTRPNESFIPKNRIIHNILNNRWKFYKSTKKFMPKKYRIRLIKFLNKKWEENKHKPQISREVKQKLIDIFREDIIKTQNLIGKDLSMWLQ